MSRLDKIEQMLLMLIGICDNYMVANDYDYFRVKEQIKRLRNDCALHIEQVYVEQVKNNKSEES